MDKISDGMERHVEFVRSFKEIWGDIFKWMEDPKNDSKTLEELNQSHMVKVMTKAYEVLQTDYVSQNKAKHFRQAISNVEQLTCCLEKDNAKFMGLVRSDLC